MSATRVFAQPKPHPRRRTATYHDKLGRRKALFSLCRDLSSTMGWIVYQQT